MVLIDATIFHSKQTFSNACDKQAFMNQLMNTIIPCHFCEKTCIVSRFRIAYWTQPMCCVVWNLPSLVCTGWFISSFFVKFRSELGIEGIFLLHPYDLWCICSTGKAFDITYVRLKFHTSRPESFAIYKRTREDGPWIPYQYYSGSCENTYSKANRGFIRTGGDEQQALCTDEFSDISPLTGGNVAFSTLEGRPSAYNFDNSPVLQVGIRRLAWEPVSASMYRMQEDCCTGDLWSHCWGKE